jgi:hypothetical protein
MSTQAIDLEHSIVKTSNVLIRTQFFSMVNACCMAGLFFDSFWSVFISIILILIFYNFSILGIRLREIFAILVTMTLLLTLMTVPLTIILIVWDNSTLAEIFPDATKSVHLFSGGEVTLLTLLVMNIIVWYLSSFITVIASWILIILLVKLERSQYRQGLHQEGLVQGPVQEATPNIQLVENPTHPTQQYNPQSTPGFDLMYV